MEETVERGKFNVFVTTQLPIVLILRGSALIMCVNPAFTDRILSLNRFDELPCHMTQALCREATTDHLIRMVEQGRLQATRFSPPTPSDTTSLEWTAKVASLDGVIPPPPIYIHPSTESPSSFTHRKLQDPTTSAWLSPADALVVIHLLFKERSESGIGVPCQRTVYFSKRDKVPQEVCQVNVPGLKGSDRIEEYGHSKLGALVSASLSACQLLQMNGMLEPAHFPAVSPFVPLPQVMVPQRSKKAKSNGVCIHPRKSPLFWSLSTETLGGLWYPTTIFIGGAVGDFGLLGILTRHPLPTIPDFRLFISGNTVNVRLRKCQPGPLSPNELEQLRRATLRVLRFVGNKPFVGELNHLPYLLFPLQRDIAPLNFPHNPYPTPEGLPRLGSPCESEVVTSMATSAFLPIMTHTTDEITRDLHDATIQDRKIEYTKHYFVDKIREDLTPLHKPQEGEVSLPRFSFHPRSHLHSASTGTTVISNIARPASRISKTSRT